ncbi:hypothetical protein PoB_007006300 [Plakobranchus ocellatus]|uniref:Uncharacterized protein n=1 Tax=Plakobranchus ocellatus TaxID=259542 RepID=A0AAV4DH50_9GAST|nr:hypothetical protein PoB_007006300 [Plakobranchus ocellatus]
MTIVLDTYKAISSHSVNLTNNYFCLILNHRRLSQEIESSLERCKLISSFMVKRTISGRSLVDSFQLDAKYIQFASSLYYDVCFDVVFHCPDGVMKMEYE